MLILAFVAAATAASASARASRVLDASPARIWLRHVRRTPLLLFVIAYTVGPAGPSLGRLDVTAGARPRFSRTLTRRRRRRTGQVRRRLASVELRHLLLEQPYRRCLRGTAHPASMIGAMAAHFLARYRFRFNYAAPLSDPSAWCYHRSSLFFPCSRSCSISGSTIRSLVLCLRCDAAGHDRSIFSRDSLHKSPDLFDAARMDGYSELEIFFRITLPVGLPALFTTAILNVIILWNEFPMPWCC